MQDNGEPAELLKLARTLSGLVAPFSCPEQWASRDSGGRAGDRGNQHVTTGWATSRRKLWQTLQAAKQGKRNRRGNWRTMKKLMWHCCSYIGLGGNPKVCCPGVRARISKTHWQKISPSSHTDLSHAAASIVYLYLCCWTASPLSCTLHVWLSLSMWTCFGCYFELDLSFIYISPPQRFLWCLWLGPQLKRTSSAQGKVWPFKEHFHL